MKLEVKQRRTWAGQAQEHASAAVCRSAFQWRSRAGLALLCWLSASCTLLLDTQKKQCQTDDDCRTRGLVDAVCVRDLCERAAGGDGDGERSGAASSDLVKGTSGSRTDASSAAAAANGTDGTDAGAPTKSQSGGSASMRAPGTASAMAPKAGSAAAPSTSVSAMNSASPSAGASGKSSMTATGTAQAGASAAMSCSGDNCCTSDADCETQGLMGGQCIDRLCWAAAAQCSADADCVDQGPEFAGGKCLSAQCRPNPRWRCETMQSTSTTEKKLLTVLVRDSLSLNPVSMVHIVACSKLDLTCASPVADATTGSDGQLKITVPANFAGYLQQTERSDYAKAMYFLPPAFPDDGVLEPFPLLTAGAIIDALATSLGASTDPTRGHMMLIAEDCDGMALPGVTFMSPQADDKTVQFYVRDLLPSTSAKATAEIGNGGYLNFPAGTAVINVDRTQDMLHLTTVTVVVRAGFISVAYMRPMLRVQVR